MVLSTRPDLACLVVARCLYELPAWRKTKTRKLPFKTFLEALWNGEYR